MLRRKLGSIPEPDQPPGVAVGEFIGPYATPEEARADFELAKRVRTEQGYLVEDTSRIELRPSGGYEIVLDYRVEFAPKKKKSSAWKYILVFALGTGAVGLVGYAATRKRK